MFWNERCGVGGVVCVVFSEFRNLAVGSFIRKVGLFRFGAVCLCVAYYGCSSGV